MVKSWFRISVLEVLGGMLDILHAIALFQTCLALLEMAPLNLKL